MAIIGRIIGLKMEKAAKRVQRPGRLEKLYLKLALLQRIGVIAIGFLFGGPIGGIIAMGLMVANGISGGRLVQGAEKALDTGRAVDKMKGFEKEVEKEGKPIHSFDNPAYFPEVNDGKEVDSVKEPVQDSKVEAELRRRENSANQKAGIGK